MTVRALVVGSLVQDLAFTVPRQPGPGEVVRASAFGAYRGGKGYNQAVALARLGADVAMVGAVGIDGHGDGFRDALTREGVDTTRLVRLPDVPTGLAVPLVTDDGEVGFVQYPGANAQLDREACADLPECELLLVQGEVPAAVSERAAEVVRGRGGLVLVNPAPVDDVTTGLVEAATVVCPNEVEARALAGDGAGGPSGPPPGEGEGAASGQGPSSGAGRALDGGALARALASDDRGAVVTLGARGAAYAAGHEEGLVAPPPVTAVDATAAGDSFCAALGLALAEGAGWPDAVAFACAAGAHAATVRGAEPSLPTREQVASLLAAGGSREDQTGGAR